MKRFVYDQHNHLVRTEEAEPECGIDFCDACGDCLECNGYDPCTEDDDKQHIWVVYIDVEESR